MKNNRILIYHSIVLFFVLAIFVPDLTAKPQISFLNLEADQASISFVETDVDYNNKVKKKVFVVRDANTEAVEPSIDTEYTPSSFFNTEDNNSVTGKGNIVVYVGEDLHGEFFVLGLLPKTNYIIDAYYWVIKEDSKDLELETFTNEFFTLTEKPKKQAYNIHYKGTTHNEMNLKWKRGSGEGCLVIVRPEIKPNLPFSGKEYEADDEYGSGSKIGNNSYVVYKGIETSVKVSNLKPDVTYFISVVEYNGEDKYISYLRQAGVANPSSKMTMLRTPKILEPNEIGITFFYPRWEKVDGAEFYELDVSTDDEFQNIIEYYKKVDVGDISDYFVDELPHEGTYYYRIRARSLKNHSFYSEIMEVELLDKE